MKPETKLCPNIECKKYFIVGEVGSCGASPKKEIQDYFCPYCSKKVGSKKCFYDVSHVKQIG